MTIALPFVKFMVILVDDFTENCVNLAELSFSFTKYIQPRTDILWKGLKFNLSFFCREEENLVKYFKTFNFTI